MQRVFRPLAVFGIASGVTVAAALQLWVAGARGSEGEFTGSAFFPGYSLSKLELVEPTLYHVDENYVDRARVDWERMYVAALDAVERRVPVVMFTREEGGKVLAIEIGDYRTLLEVPPISSRQQLQEELRRVAVLLDAHVTPEDVPADRGTGTQRMAELEYAMVNGMLKTLDPHSLLLPPDDAHEMDLENQGEFGGLGIAVETDPRDGRLMIDYPFRDTPAWEAGLQADDRILRIDGESTLNMTLDDAVRRLRGRVDEPVVLEIGRAGLTDPLQVTLVRQWVEVNPVEGALLDGNIAVVRISGFHDKVESSLHEVLGRMHREAGAAGGELEGLVLDLRGNPGGFLNQAVKVADTFLETGDIVSTVDSEGRRADLERAHRGAEPMYPIVVLVDAQSASASEIVAGALRFNERAVVMGERTFGKGSVQNLHPFFDSSKLKLTISTYRTPGDRSIQAVGIPADIELHPVIVPSDPAVPVRMFHRERVRREADLDRSLEGVTFQAQEPAYRIPWLEPELSRRRSDEIEWEKDWQVMLARDVLKASTGWRRSDVLAAAAPVVARARRVGQDATQQALAKRSLDWSQGPAAARGATLPVTVRLDLGDDGALQAGVRESVGLVVTNTTDRPLYQVAAVAIDSEVLEGEEFYFGKLAPGESRRFERAVELQHGWPAERAPLTLELRDSGAGPLGTWTTEVPVTGHPASSLAWSWKALEPDGDGTLGEGDGVRLELTVENQGDGPSYEPFARLRNLSGRSVEIALGTLAPGDPVDRDGVACAADAEGALPTGCLRVLASGARWTGTFEFKVASLPEGGEPVELELSLGDQSYDYGAVVRSAFYDWYSQTEHLALVPGQPLPSAALRRPPRISVTRAPDARVEGGRATVSGVVTDDEGLAHVMVYAGEDKVFFEGTQAASRVQSLPFTADVTLDPGQNVLAILATDDQGFVASRSVVTWADVPELARVSVPVP